MNTKLTLSLDSRVISKAKEYALDQRISLSELVENYFRLLTRDIQDQEKNQVQDKSGGYSPIEKYRGAFQLQDEREYREILKDELWKKYMK